MTVFDPDTTLLSFATVSIISGFDAANDVLSYTAPNGSHVVFDSYTNGVLKIKSDGQATAGDFQTALQQVTFTDLGSSSTTARVLQFQADDGQAANHLSPTGVNRTITVAVPASAIAGTVWLDKDGDGKFNNSDTVVAGAVVELFTQGGTSLGMQVTGADGTYRFVPGTAPAGTMVYIQVRPPANLGYAAKDVAHAAGEVVSDLNTGTGNTDPFAVGLSGTISENAGLTGAPDVWIRVSRRHDRHDDGGRGGD